MLEAVIAQPQGVDPARRTEIERYTKLFWINNGPYNNLTARKFVLKTTPAAFTAAVKAAVQAGATVATPSGESLDAMLTRLEPMFFDAAFEPIVTNKAPGPGKDILLDSANNLYSGVSFKEAEAFKKAGLEKNGLNSRLVKQNGKLVEEVYKVGGRYSKEITAIVSHLEAAIPVRARADGQRAARADPVVPHRRRRRPREVRHRVGGRQGLADRRHQRVHRGVPGRARRQGRRGKRWSSSSTGRRPSASASSPTTRSGSRTTCPSTPSTGRPT